MFLRVDPADRRPIYQQVVDGIKLLIASGGLAEGTPLPPVRQVAGDLGVNLNTIATAYRQLQTEGLILVRHGSRAVVTSRHATERKTDDLRRPLRNALADCLLAGFGPREILRMVSAELKALAKEGR